MTLSEAIVHITKITPQSWPWNCTDLGGGRRPVLTDTAIATILNAVASGDLIPKADAEMAVVLAYQRAADAVTKDEAAGDISPGAAQWFRDTIRALALSARLAEVDAERDAAREAMMNAGIASHVAKRETTDAEAREAKLREAATLCRDVAKKAMLALMGKGPDELLLADEIHKADDKMRAALQGETK